jgi:hypothetical protein
LNTKKKRIAYQIYDICDEKGCSCRNAKRFLFCRKIAQELKISSGSFLAKFKSTNKIQNYPFSLSKEQYANKGLSC